MQQIIHHNTSPDQENKEFLIALFQKFQNTQDSSILQTHNTILNDDSQLLLKNLSALDLNNQLYNTHHHLLLLQNDHLIEALTIDTLEQIFYPFNPSAHKSVLEFRQQLQTTIITKWTDKKNIKQIFEHMKQGGNTIILMNHPTYFTPGILIQLLEELNTDIANLNNNLYTILWWALMTNIQGKLAQWTSNILKTHPQTQNGIIPTITSAQERGVYQFIRMTLNEYRKQSKPGKIFLIAPTATRDTIQRRENNWTIEKDIYLHNDENNSVRKTLNLVDKMIDSNTMILLAWVNESELKNPYHINPSNNEWRKNCIIPINTQLYTPKEIEAFKNLCANKQVMKTIADLITDEYNTTIGKLIQQ